MKKLFFAVGLLALFKTQRLSAQSDPIAVMQKIFAAYHAESAIRFTGSMRMYAKSNPDKTLERMQSSFAMRGNSFYCSLGPVEMLLNDTYYVSADKTDKLLMIGRQKDLKGAGQSPVLNLGQLTELIKQKKIKASLSNKGRSSLLQLTDEQAVTGYNAYQIQFNSATGYMETVVIESTNYNTAGNTMVLAINYTHPVAITAGKDLFSEKNFFALVKNKVTVTDNYKGYQLINQL